MMDKSDYGENIMAHLRDETTYERLQKNPTAVEPTEEDYYKVYTSSEIPLSFYGLPKIHKDGAPLRPIASSCGVLTPKLAKYLILILKPLAGKMDSFKQNSVDFMQKLSEIMLGPSETLTSYNVKYLFTCIPPQGALAAVRKRLEKDATYIGETQQPLHKRVYQHAAPNSSSAIADHTCQTGHRLSLANFQILEREEDWGRRGIREAVQEHISSPTLNRNKGLRYCLSHKWDRPFGVSQTILPPDDGHRNNV